MDQQMYAGQPAQVIKDNLEANADKTEMLVFEKQLSSDEVVILKDVFVQDNINLSRIKEEFEKIKEQFANKIKPIEKMLAENLSTLKTKSRQVEEKVYLFADQETKMMNYYDASGQLINSRRLLPEERQMSILREASNG